MRGHDNCESWEVMIIVNHMVGAKYKIQKNADVMLQEGQEVRRAIETFAS